MREPLTPAERAALEHSSHFRPTFWCGVRAAKAGRPKSECPYEDRPGPASRNTWSRAWRNAWCDGWEHGDTERRAAESAERKEVARG